MADGPSEHDLPEGPLDPSEAVTDDEVLEAEAIAEGDPSRDEQVFVDGTVGRSDLAAERDEYLDALQRVQAEFDNFKKRTARERSELTQRAHAQLADRLLPVVDACEAAISHGASDVEPIYKSLLDALEKEGLERMNPEGQPFDPTLHEAVMHEPGDGHEPVVTEILRTGYSWKGQVLRPAMVKVRG
jgi:molecular chaperone GrpE